MGRDNTGKVLDLFRELHGSVLSKRDSTDKGNSIVLSATSLHLLLKSNLPAKEILWAWYQYFEKERGESIYKTLAPWEDETLLEILASCSFSWNINTVRASGLVFLQEHYREVLLCLGDAIGMRLDAFKTMNDSELEAQLKAGSRVLDSHISNIVRLIRLKPVALAQREGLYQTLSSEYLRTAATTLIERATTEDFWKQPPTELTFVLDGCEKLKVYLLSVANRLGLHYANGQGFAQGQDPKGQYGDQQYGDQQYSGRKYADSQYNDYNSHSDSRPSSKKPTSQQDLSESLAILGLDGKADLEQVRSAYRKLVKYIHPDQGGSVGEFIRVQEAYEYLMERWQ